MMEGSVNPILELYFYNKRNDQLINDFFNENVINTLKKIFDEEINILPSNDVKGIPANFEIKFNQSYKSFIIKNCFDGCNIFCEIFNTGNCKIILDIPCIYYPALNQLDSEIYTKELNKTRNFDTLDDFKFIEIQCCQVNV